MGEERQLLERIRTAAEELEARYANELLDDQDTDAELRNWLDGNNTPLPWTDPDHVTPDEWFFITTLYGTMDLAGQRTHIRKFYPRLFVDMAQRDIRNFISNMAEYQGLRQPWMAQRLARMGSFLRENGLTMDQYAQELRELEQTATPEDISPALTKLASDMRSEGVKTLSVFVRDCLGGNSFSIDSRVEKELKRWDLPVDERKLISLSLEIGRDPKKLARMFYTAGGST